VKVAVIGAGAWGTTLSILFSEAGHDVSLWVFEDRLCAKMIEQRENKWYLPGLPLPVSIDVTNDLAEAADGAELVVFAVPSKHIRNVAANVSEHVSKAAIILSAAKGLEQGTGKRMTEVLKEGFPSHKIAVITGPNLSKEIARGLPATTVIASEDVLTAQKIQSALTLDRFRVYTSNDIIGVELGGALKNVIAIAAGVVDGLELGDNARAGLMVRGIVEIARLGCVLGASMETLSGLTGMGDLIATCSSKLSRNHRIGEALARGKTLNEILIGMREVAEGIDTTKVAMELSRKHKIDMPITEQVYKVLFEGKDPYQAISDLMTREKKGENR
jgi:glycerol-3-phosphate dehydrogenase (NAD(P)+)